MKTEKIDKVMGIIFGVFFIIAGIAVITLSSASVGISIIIAILCFPLGVVLLIPRIKKSKEVGTEQAEKKKPFLNKREMRNLNIGVIVCISTLTSVAALALYVTITRYLFLSIMSTLNVGFLLFVIVILIISLVQYMREKNRDNKKIEQIYSRYGEEEAKGKGKRK